MANPRKRKAIKDGRMEQMISKKNKTKTVEKEVVIASEVKVETPKSTKPPMDPFIAKELKEFRPIRKKPQLRKGLQKPQLRKKPQLGKEPPSRKKQVINE